MGWGLVIALVAVVGIGVYLFAALKAYNALTLPKEKYEGGVPPSPYENVVFSARGQNYPVYAFFLAAEPSAPVLIRVHGWQSSRHKELEIQISSDMRNLGFNVLALDLGDGGGDTIHNGRIGMGFEERWDVLGAVDFLLDRGFTRERIGLVGRSMGATTVLMAALLEPEIKAVWADSPFESVATLLAEVVSKQGFTPALVPGGMLWGYLMTRAKGWQVAPIKFGPQLSVNQQAVFLIHCDEDPFIPYKHSQNIYAAYKKAGVEVTFWGTSCNEHGRASVYHPTEYLDKLGSFFRQHLSSQSR